MITPVSLNDIDHHGTDILLQNQSDRISRLDMLLHDQRTGGPDRRMPREVELCPRGENAHAIGIAVVFRQDEGRFRKVELASDFLHALGRDTGGVRQNRELVAAERRRTEHIDEVKGIFHELMLLAPAQALTTKSISPQAPSGSAATAIVVRAGKG